MKKNRGRVKASFRDPSGFLFTRAGKLYRQINHHYQDEYDLLMSSGLYAALVNADLLIPHEEVDIEAENPETAYKIIAPEIVPFISYPYEWCFSQLSDAATLTLEIQKRAMDFGMSLKDSSAYNIAFRNGLPVLIDSLSFERYREGKPWVPYRQFCQHFLAPLALAAYKDIRLTQLSRVYIDGIPLDLASRLLPWRTRFNFNLMTHIHLHAAAQSKYADQEIDKEQIRRGMSKTALAGLIHSLDGSIKRLKWAPGDSAWADYTDFHSYSDSAFHHKKEIVARFIERTKPDTVWDLGANVGVFSRIASEAGAQTVAFDFDVSAVEGNYRACVDLREERVLPLVMDLTNPSPDIGWSHAERDSLVRRGPADIVMALALIHHLAISNNVPLRNVADFLHQIARWLIIEFIPKEDSQVKKLLATREDIFPLYNPQGFTDAFQSRFTIHEEIEIHDTKRILYLMEAKANS